MSIDSQTKALVEQVNSSAGPQLHEMPLADARAALKELNIKLAAPHCDVYRCEKILIPTENGDVAARLYRPGPVEEGLKQPVVLFMHGGGFALGDTESHDSLVRYICKHADTVVISVDYRLAPEHKFPSGVEDCYASLRWIVENAGELNVDRNRIAVAGDSAGGNFSAVLCQLANSRNGPRIACQVLLYPLVDMRNDAEYPSRMEFADGYFLTREGIAWCSEQYFVDKTEDGKDLRASPILAENIAALPPALIVTAGYDPLRDEGSHYKDRLVSAGVEVEYRCFDNTIHGFLSFGGILDIAIEGLDYVTGYMNRKLHA